MNSFENLVLVVEAKGEVLSSNLDVFRESVRENLLLVNRDLRSDEDFGQAELDVKGLKFAEEVVKEAKRKALEDAEGLNAFFVALDESADEVRQARLELEKLIKERKEKVKKELVEEAVGALDCDFSLRSRFNGVFDSEVKGKKSVDSIKKGLARAVALCNGSIRESREVIAFFKAQYGDHSVPDELSLEVMNASVVKVELQRRAELKRADEEKARLVEEAAQARREAQVARAQVAQVAEVAEVPTQPASMQVNELAGASVGASSSVGASVGVGVVGGGSSVGLSGVCCVRQARSAVEEWADFKMGVVAVFRKIKEARESLRYEENVDRVAVFARAVNEAWQVANSKDGGSLS
ncbi:MAG: hypothetical protein RR808_09660 [Akkermansia sp.]